MKHHHGGRHHNVHRNRRQRLGPTRRPGTTSSKVDQIGSRRHEKGFNVDQLKPPLVRTLMTLCMYHAQQCRFRQHPLLHRHWNMNRRRRRRRRQEFRRSPHHVDQRSRSIHHHRHDTNLILCHKVLYQRLLRSWLRKKQLFQR